VLEFRQLKLVLIRIVHGISSFQIISHFKCCRFRIKHFICPINSSIVLCCICIFGNKRMST